MDEDLDFAELMEKDEEAWQGDVVLEYLAVQCAELEEEIACLKRNMEFLAFKPEGDKASRRMQEIRQEMDSLEKAFEGARKELGETEKRYQELTDERAREAEASRKGENRETEEAAAGDMQAAAKQQEANFRQHRRGR